MIKCKIPNINNVKPPYSRRLPLTHWFSIGTPSIVFLFYFGLFDPIVGHVTGIYIRVTMLPLCATLLAHPMKPSCSVVNGMQKVVSQNTNGPYYKQNKIQQKIQNTNTTKYKRTKYKLPEYICNKIQMQQNTKRQNTNRTKYKIP